MRDLQVQLEQYLRDALGIPMLITPWKKGERLPVFLRERYAFLLGQVLDCPCLFMVDKREHEEAPAIIAKHMEQVRPKYSQPVVYVRNHVTAYNRKRLVEHQIPFIVPGNQMYLPHLGVDFREYFRGPRPTQNQLRPSTQAVLVYALLKDADSLGPTAMAERLGYAAMTMSRAFNELEAADLIVPTVTGRGKDRKLRLSAPKPKIWKKAQSILRSPVKTCHTVHLSSNKNLPGPLAGMTALAHHSMLVEPMNSTIALSREDWKSLQQRKKAYSVPLGDPGAILIEEWRYAPTFFAAHGRVDRLSLYLSLRGMKDERVQDALDDMMEKMSW
jgi:DNA-binding transcriptional regulator YhcF (GntR family)